MKLHFETYRINCTHPFGISRSSHAYYDIVYVYLEHQGLIGRGEAAPSGRYNESTKDILAVLSQGIDAPDTIEDPKIFSEKIALQSFRLKSLTLSIMLETKQLTLLTLETT